MPKTKISEGLIKVGFMEEELKDLTRICNAAIGFAEERGLGDLEDKTELWKKNFKTILKTHKKEK
jgi:hypothetical protein